MALKMGVALTTYYISGMIIRVGFREGLFGRGPATPATLLRGLTNHGCQPLTSHGMILQVPKRPTSEQVYLED